MNDPARMASVVAESELAMPRVQPHIEWVT